MKTIRIIISAILALALCLPLTVSASWLGTRTLPTVYLTDNDGYVPAIDGVITDDEGWSEYLPFDDTTVCEFWAQAPITVEGCFNYAADSNGLYFAMSIAENGSGYKLDWTGEPYGEPWTGNSFRFSSGYDDVGSYWNGEGEGYGFNGDVIVLAFDPARKLYENGYTENSDISPWYCIGFFADGTVHVYRENINPGDITARVKVAGIGGPAINGPAGGCNVELFLPWDIIIGDINDYTEIYGDGDIGLTKEDILSKGNETKATVMYMDRYYDSGLGSVETWTRLITVPERLPSGIKGSSGSGSDIQSYGVTLAFDGISSTAFNFKDVSNNDWYCDPVRYCVEHGYMSGLSDTVFAPNNKLNRAMFVTIMRAVSGANAKLTNTPFTDVPEYEWFASSVKWANDNWIARGTSDTTFSPYMNITREQMAVMMYQLAAYLGKTRNADPIYLAKYKDKGSISSWAQTAMTWAVQNQLFTGYEDGTLKPKNTATRAEAATIIRAFCENLY